MKRIYSIPKLFCTLVIMVILGMVFTKIFNNNKWLTITQQDVDSLLNTVWQVHAGITTLSIAILALLIGFSQQKKYGMKVLDFLLKENRRFVKFQDEVILGLVLILVQYFFVAYSALAGAIFIFTISILLTIHMLHSSIKLILFEEVVKNEMKAYILKQCKDAIEKENLMVE
ncbi:hypothetical protein [Paenibacillus antarcticus]|uniref:Uncharacterized protein n=1 Tax=Paenibacillus antarcticus TaxID=253703 RepID=A0A168L8U7_9BACL|nr:hypothetical protein [Paenibacillus antarcticus]OAB43039.1 hypothetical protein PBAT_18745 [Paenibacillus antarcticus]